MEEAKWYVVHTFSGYENKVKVDIEKTVENRNLQDQILEVAIPLQEVMENKDGQKKSSMRKILIHLTRFSSIFYPAFLKAGQVFYIEKACPKRFVSDTLSS